MSSERLHRALYAARTFSWIPDPRRFLPLPALPVDRPIFLLGTQGGGLTLLSRMVRRHPEVISAAGNSDYWSSADELQNVYGQILPFELTGLRYKAPPHPVLTAPRSWTYAARDLFAIYRRTAADATPELRDTLLRIIRLSAVRHAHDRRRFRFLDKSQCMSVRLGLVNALLEGCDPRFVLVPREPYISVYRAATGKAGDMRRLADAIPYEERIDICAEHYGNCMRAVFTDCDADAIPLHLCRFEDLLQTPEQTLRAVCDFVGLDFRPDMLPAPEHRLPLGSRFHDRWFPIKPDINQPYRRKLDTATVAAVNRHCADVIDRLGYRRLGMADIETAA